MTHRPTLVLARDLERASQIEEAATSTAARTRQDLASLHRWESFPFLQTQLLRLVAVAGLAVFCAGERKGAREGRGTFGANLRWPYATSNKSEENEEKRQQNARLTTNRHCSLANMRQPVPRLQKLKV